MPACKREAKNVERCKHASRLPELKAKLDVCEAAQALHKALTEI